MQGFCKALHAPARALQTAADYRKHSTEVVSGPAMYTRTPRTSPSQRGGGWGWEGGGTAGSGRGAGWRHRLRNGPGARPGCCTARPSPPREPPHRDGLMVRGCTESRARQPPPCPSLMRGGEFGIPRLSAAPSEFFTAGSQGAPGFGCPCSPGTAYTASHFSGAGSPSFSLRLCSASSSPDPRGAAPVRLGAVVGRGWLGAAVHGARHPRSLLSSPGTALLRMPPPAASLSCCWSLGGALILSVRYPLYYGGGNGRVFRECLSRRGCPHARHC